MADRAVGSKRALLLLCPVVRHSLHFQRPFASFKAVQGVRARILFNCQHTCLTPGRLMTRLEQEIPPHISAHANAASHHAREGGGGGGGRVQGRRCKAEAEVEAEVEVEVGM